MNFYIFHIRSLRDIYIYVSANINIFFLAQQPPGLLWVSDQLVAETST